MKKWKLIESTKLFESKWLTLKSNSYDIGDGVVRNDYYHIDRPDYVLIVAKKVDEKIVLLRQYRRGVDEVLYELPAGWIDKGETAVQAAEREIKEETGFSGKGVLLGTFVAQPGFMSMRAHIVFVKLDASTSSKDLDEDENNEKYYFSIEQIKKMIVNGEITDMGCISAINLYLLKNSLS